MSQGPAQTDHERTLPVKTQMRSLALGAVLALIFALFSVPLPVAAAVTIAGGEVYGTWTAADSPYLIDGDIVVPAGQTLTIEPGVEVIFQSYYKLSVHGTLLAEGTQGAPILFGGGHPTAGWGGVRFYGGSDGSRLDYAIVEKARATGVDSEKVGGGLYVEDASPTFSHTTVRDNYATLGGGGIALVRSNATLSDNTIVNNSAGMGGSASGGGIYMTDSSPQLTRNVIHGNSIGVAGTFSTPTGLGGGIYAYRSSPVLRYNVISDNAVNAQSNSHARGGGLYFYFGSPDLVGNTIVGNSVPDPFIETYSREGGGIYLYGSNLTIVNTLLWDNSPEQIYVDEFATLTVAYTDLQGGQTGVLTEGSPTLNNAGGNLNADPRFVDAASGDYQLQPNSPAIDAGTAFFQWNGRVLVDLGPDQYVGAAPDMGAFESQSSGGSNQPPTAAASAQPASGGAPLEVQFSADGSSDPDGTIVSYAWDLGDGSTSFEANPVHTYDNAGVYDVTLTVTDDDGATGSDALVVTVSQATQKAVHVHDQAVVRVKYRRWYLAQDTVVIADQDDLPVAGALVTVRYTGPTQGQASGTTGADGMVVLRTSLTRRAEDSWCFEVISIVKEGYVYDDAANIVTTQCEAQ
jgi:parallel beta-helix repeat protein